MEEKKGVKGNVQKRKLLSWKKGKMSWQSAAFLRKEIEKQSDTAGEVTGTKEQLALFTNAKLQMLWEKKT